MLETFDELLARDEAPDEPTPEDIHNLLPEVINHLDEPDNIDIEELLNDYTEDGQHGC